MTRLLPPLVLTLAPFVAWSCGPMTPPQPVSGAEEARIKAELQGRSFRPFELSKDASPRKGVILDFFGPISIWAQYSEDRRAVNEWEIVSTDYRIEKGIIVNFSRVARYRASVSVHPSHRPS